MRKLVVQQFITVDGIMAEPDGGMSFVTGKPFKQSDDEDFKAEAMAFLDRVDAMILGANTYKMFVQYWPTTTEEGDFADKLNRLDKIVASSSLTSAPWGDYSAATITSDPVAMLTELKQQDGKDMVVWGSIQLMNQLFEANIVDEVQLRICPTTRGEGVHMFAGQHDLELIETKAYERGMVVSKYKVIK